MTPSNGKAARAGQRGFTLVEAMVAMVISMIVGMSLYFLYNHQQKQYLAEKSSSEMQDNVRFVLDAMGRDIIMTGYRPVTSPGISEASDERLTFEYWDEKAQVSAPYDKHYKITYRIDTTKPERPLVREVQRYNPGAPVGSQWTAATPYTVGEFLMPDPNNHNTDPPLKFQYYRQDNTLFSPAPGTDITKLPDIRNIKVQATVRSYDPDPFTKKYRYTTLTRTFQARNLGISGTPMDLTPPAVPTGLQAIDPGICRTLSVRWTANIEPDLDGYYLYLGQEPGVYNRKLRLGAAVTSYTFSDLTSTMSTDGTPVTYYLALLAFDKSANQSGMSAEISGNPSPSVTDFAQVASRGNDTTLNPVKPFPPGSFDALDGSSENETVLTWTPTASPDAVRYLLYRCPRSGYPAGPEENCTAFQGAVGTALLPYLVTSPDITTTSYADSNLIGCVEHFYKIAAVNCDNSLVSAYLSTEYSRCYGDGAGAAADLPRANISDSTPYDNTRIDNVPYPVPQLSSTPGWKRVFISMTNPNFTDDPDFAFTNIYFSKTGFPTFVPDSCAVDPTTGTLVPDSSGVFRQPGNATGNSFKHDSETEAVPLEPSLTDLATYYYLAVSHDRCGNCTSITDSATTLSELCGDDPPGLPQCSPPVTLAVDSQGCSGYVHLAWNGDCLKEGVLTLNADFAGFHLFRNEGQTFSPSTAVELTGGVPQWFQTYTDASLEEGKYYSYAVRWADCAYEHGNRVDEGNISNPSVNGGKLEGVSIGRIDSDNNNVVLTGDLSLSPPTYLHSSVTFFVKNTSAAQMTINSLNISWQNQLAFLKSVVIGDNLTTSRQTVWEATPPLTMGSTGGVITVSKPLNGLDLQIPVTFHFATVNGVEDPNSDMREEVINLAVNYTNTSTGTTGCARNGILEVPAGPVVNQVTQDMPLSPTDAWAVPGYSGTNLKDQVVVPGGSLVTVFANVVDNSGNGISAVKVYYYIDASKTLTAPPADTGVNYTPLEMRRVSGELWKLYTVDPVDNTDHRIPVADNASIWYYLVAVDAQGNFDRDPEVQAGAYQYYQQQGNVCSNTPRPPTLGGKVVGTNVELAWVAPTFNSNGTVCTDLAGYHIFRYDGISWNLIKDITSADTLAYTDVNPAGINTVRYTYYVTAYDTCAPTPKESLGSNNYSECLGEAPCQINIGRIEAHPGGAFYPGDSFGITMDVCGNTLPDIWVQDCSMVAEDADPIHMVNDGFGRFSIDPAYYEGRTTVKTWLRADYPPSYKDLDLYLDDSGVDTIKVQGYFLSRPNDSLCESTALCQQTIAVAPATPAVINLEPAAIANSCTAGTNLPPGSFEVWNTGTSTLNYSISDNAPWLSVTPVSGSSTGEHDVITINYTTAALPAGNYTGTITVSDPTASNSPQTLTVSLSVAALPPPVIAVSPTSLSAGVQVGGNPAAQSFQVWNSGVQTLNFAVSTSAAWLTAAPATGSSTGTTDKKTVAVTYNTATLAAGTYNAVITVTDALASNSPLTIPVMLTVTAVPAAAITLSTAALTASTQVGGSPAGQTFTVRNSAAAGAATLNFAVADNQTWLAVTPATGTSLPGGADPKTITVTYATAGLAAGTYTAVITVTDPAASNSPQTITVSLSVTAIPQATLTLSTATLSPTALVGANAASQTFQVWNSSAAGSAVLNFAVAKNQAWLTVAPTGGTSNPGGTDKKTVTVTYATAALAAGTYTAVITVTDPAAIGNPRTITVTLVVTANPCTNPLAPGAPTGLTAVAAGGNCGGYVANLSWTAPAGGAGLGPVSYYQVFECSGAGCTPVATSPTVTTTTTSVSRTTNKKLNSPTGVYRWAIKAVNNQCTTNIKSSPLSNIFNDPCP